MYHRSRFILFLAFTGLSIIHAGAATKGTQQHDALIPQRADFSALGVNWKASDANKANAKKMWAAISEARKDQAETDRKLYVIYLSFKGRDPLPDFEGRYDKILKNIQSYYADQMAENGFPPLTFALELDDQKKLIVNRGHVDKTLEECKQLAKENKLGTITRDEAKRVLAEKGIDADNNHILIVCQLPDGVGPYYGGGRQLTGNAWICDELSLEPKMFTNTDYYGGRFNASYGMNATIYIGGTAHELGHAFGLPHTAHGWDYVDAGRSLMGDGNSSYANELRGEGKGTSLHPADAARIASVPIFTGKNTPAKTYHVVPTYSDLKTKMLADGLEISGKVTADAKPYCVVLHYDPAGNSDYDANAVVVPVAEDGSFSGVLRRPDYKGDMEFRMTATTVDGRQSTVGYPGKATANGLEIPTLK